MMARAAKIAVLVLLLGAGLYLSFELGRYQAGFSLFDQRRHSGELNASIEERDARIEMLQRRQAILETSGEIDAETYAAVETELAQLQASIQGLEEELVFYRGIVSPGDGVVGLRIQSVEIQPGVEAGEHLLRLLLVQSIVHNDRVTGTVRMRVNGSLSGEEAALGLGELAPDGAVTEIPYGFRYFQSIVQNLVLPDGFVPEQIEIEIWPREPRGETVTQVFSWAQVSG